MGLGPVVWCPSCGPSISFRQMTSKVFALCVAWLYASAPVSALVPSKPASTPARHSCCWNPVLRGASCKPQRLVQHIQRGSHWQLLIFSQYLSRYLPDSVSFEAVYLNWRTAWCRRSLSKHLATVEVSFPAIASILHDNVLPWDIIPFIRYTKRIIL